MAVSNVRLFVDHPLGAGQSVLLSREQAHYLFGVMRLSAGDQLHLFDGKNGEWLAEVAEVGKRKGVLLCVNHTAPLRLPPDLWLLFAPIKKARTDFIVEKATEMGAARICPVQTEFTNSERIRRDRLQAHAVEAAEQCGGTFVPKVADLMPLGKLLDTWPKDRKLIFCDEALVDENALSSWEKYPGGQAKPAGAEPPRTAILIGPEGGFSEAERTRLRNMAHPVSLGPRILRADTAAVAALALWQAQFGDWR